MFNFEKLKKQIKAYREEKKLERLQEKVEGVQEEKFEKRGVEEEVKEKPLRQKVVKPLTKTDILTQKLKEARLARIEQLQKAVKSDE